LNAFVAYRLPGEENAQFLNTLTAFQNEASFAIVPFVANSDYQPFYFSGDAAAYQRALIDIVDSPNNKAHHITSKTEYSTHFNLYQEAFSQNKLDKAILSRIIAEPFNSNKLAPLFEALVDLRPDAFIYWFFHPVHGHWLGATPEILLSQNDMRYETVSLAGTLYNGNQWTNKEINEQEIVSSYISDTLKTCEIDEYDKIGPVTVEAGPIKHLKTTFAWQKHCDTMQLANLLHPTPAVCGLPKKEALDFILNTEKHERGYYTGYLGPIIKGQPKFYVNLRCLNLINNQAYLFVGGGLTQDSDLEHEWKETEHKANSLLGVMENL